MTEAYLLKLQLFIENAKNNKWVDDGLRYFKLAICERVRY